MDFKIKSYRPLFSRVLVTANMIQIKNKDGNIEDTDQMKPYQTIMSLGDICNSRLKVGDIVLLNPNSFKKTKSVNSPIEGTRHTQQRYEDYYEFNTIEIDENTYMEIYDSDIKAVIEVEEFEPKSTLITGGIGISKDMDFKKAKIDGKGLIETM